MLIFIAMRKQTIKYLKVEELKPYYTYRILARNGRVGIWRPDTGDFLLRRTKFYDTYTFGEIHWDLDDNFGTAKPIEELEQSPFDYGDMQYVSMTWDEYCGCFDKELPDWAEPHEKVSIRPKEKAILNYLKGWEEKMDTPHPREPYNGKDDV